MILRVDEISKSRDFFFQKEGSKTNSHRIFSEILLNRDLLAHVCFFSEKSGGG